MLAMVETVPVAFWTTMRAWKKCIYLSNFLTSKSQLDHTVKAIYSSEGHLAPNL